MIIAKLIGGLGNQMFQYAAARAVAHRTKLPLKLDITSFERYKLHSYMLSAYNIKESLAAKDDVQQFLKHSFFPWQKKKIFKERWFHFDPDLLKVKGGAILDGYWQSEKYFADISDIIRREFTIKSNSDSINIQKSQEIINANSVSVHIRRCDYVNNPGTNQYHGTCSLEYYRNAVALVTEHCKDPHFFLFSDDPAWVKTNFKTDHPVSFVDHNSTVKGYEDMSLMSLCKHHIIANSTFSWWGAWLSNNPDKIVIAPSRWFNDPNIDTVDLLPLSWIKL